MKGLIMEWISVRDRFPEGNEAVIATDGDQVGEMIFFSKDNSFETDEGSTFDFPVTHWISLPKSPTKQLKILKREVYNTGRMHILRLNQEYLDEIEDAYLKRIPLKDKIIIRREWILIRSDIDFEIIGNFIVEVALLKNNSKLENFK